MPEFELDQESVWRAEKLSSQLMQELRMVSEEGPPPAARGGELFSERRYVEEVEGVPINDVLANVNQMATEFAMARRSGSEILCLKLGEAELAPISMAAFFPSPFWPSAGSEGWIEFWQRYFPFPFPPLGFWQDMLRRTALQEEPLMVTNVREAEPGIGRSLSAFLSYRFAGMKKWADWIQGSGTRLFGSLTGPPVGKVPGSSDPPPPPAVGPGGGLQVQVSCLTPGLRIHISPAYFISWMFFGSPTTPVMGYVLPGRYVFAGDGPMLPRRTRDHGVFSIPPTYYAALTRF